MATEQYHAIGRRKTSVARVYLRPGNGTWEVNGRTLEQHLPRHVLRQSATRPLAARALLKVSEDFRVRLRGEDLLTRDPREVERKKPGRPGARKRFQFSKR